MVVMVLMIMVTTKIVAGDGVDDYGDDDDSR